MHEGGKGKDKGLRIGEEVVEDRMGEGLTKKQRTHAKDINSHHCKHLSFVSDAVIKYLDKITT